MGKHIHLTASLAFLCLIVFSFAPRTLASAGATWIAHQSAAEVNQWNSVAYGNGTFVAVAESSNTMSSPDGITWTAHPSAVPGNRWNSVAYGNGLFVAVASYGTNQVMTSPDGITWTAHASAVEGNSWDSVTYGNGLFVAVASSGTNQVMTSPDGITWTARPSAITWNWQRSIVTYGNGLFVAVQGGNTMTSPDGIIWTAHAAVLNSWESITYGNGLFVAVASSGINQVMTSPDGTTWTAHVSAVEGNVWESVTYGNGTFVAVAARGTNQVMTSPDGTTWTAHPSASEGNFWYSVTYGNGTFVAVAMYGLNKVMTSSGSPDLVTENLTGSGSFTTVGSTLKFSGDVLNAGAGPALATSTARFCIDNASCLTSETGEIGKDTVDTLAAGTSSTTFSHTWVSTTGNHTVYFCADVGATVVESDETNNCTSATFTIAPPASASDLTTQNLTASGSMTPGSTLAFSGNIANVGLGDAVPSFTNRFCIDNASCLTTSTGQIGTDAVTGGSVWTAHANPGGQGWTSVAYGSGTFVAVGGLIQPVMSSPDGITWTAHSAPAGEWTSVTYGSGTFVAVSDYGTNQVMTSPDGTTWTAHVSAVEGNSWDSITYGNGLFVAVASSGTNQVMTSPDGTTWTAHPSAVEGNAWKSVTYGNGTFVAVAAWGTNQVMTSPDGITWTGHPSAAEGNFWQSVAYGSGTFVAVAAYTNQAMTSSNGITWTTHVANTSSMYGWMSVTYGNGTFVAVTGGDTAASPDGITWTTHSPAVAENYWDSVTYGNGLFVAVAYNYVTHLVMTSPAVALTAGASSPTFSHSWVATAGTHTIYFCADISAAVAESDETNNCSSSTFTISVPSPVATLTATPSTITQSHPSSILTWSSSADAVSCTAVGGFSTGGVTSNKVGISVSPPTTSYYQIYCDNATGGRGYSNIEQITVPNPAVSIKASPMRVPIGGRTEISWTTSDVDECYVTRNNSPWLQPTLSNGLLPIGSDIVTGIASQTVFAITCYTPGMPQVGPLAATTTVNIRTIFQNY